MYSSKDNTTLGARNSSHFVTQANFKPRTLNVALALALTSVLVPQAYAQQSVHAEGSLSEVVVSGSAMKNNSENYVSSPTTTAIGLALDLKETPQSISVITDKQKEQRNANSYNEVVNMMPGVDVDSSTHLGVFYRISVRGSAPNDRMVNGNISHGGGRNTAYASMEDMVIYDRVEIIRGSAGMMGITGSPSAVINSVLKKPLKKRAGEMSLSYGKWGYKRASGDISVPLNTDGSIRSRYVLGLTQGKTFIDRYDPKNLTAMAVVEADITPSTVASLGVTTVQNKIDNDIYDVPRNFVSKDAKTGKKVETPINLRRGTNVLGEHGFYRYKEWKVLGEVKHEFNDDWTAKASFDYSRRRSDVAIYKPDFFGRGGVTDLPDFNTPFKLQAYKHYMKKSPTNKDIWNFNISTTGHFDLLGRKHDLSFGYNTNTIKSFSDKYAADTPFVVIPSLNDWLSRNGQHERTTFTKTGNGEKDKTVNHNAYLTSRFTLTDRMKVILGTSYIYTDYKSGEYTTSKAAKLERENYAKAFVPYAGILVDINRNWTSYFSYSDIFSPSWARDKNYKFLEPERGNTFELGVKGNINPNLLVSAASYVTYNKNSAVEDEEFNECVQNGQCALPAGAEIGFEAYKPGGKDSRVRGFELEAIGQIRDGWNVTASFTRHKYNSIRSGRTTSSPNLLKASSYYSLPATWWQGADNVTLGAAVRFNSSYKDRNSVKESSRTIFDASVDYQITKNANLALFVTNLTDTKFFNGGHPNQGQYNEPRNIKLRLKTTF